MIDDPRDKLQYRLYRDLRLKPLVRLAMAVPALAGPRHDAVRFDQFLRGHCGTPWTDYGHAAVLLLELWEKPTVRTSLLTAITDTPGNLRVAQQLLTCIADAPLVCEARVLPAIRRAPAIAIPKSGGQREEQLTKRLSTTQLYEIHKGAK